MDGDSNLVDIVGVKDASDARIDPATEGTLLLLKDQASSEFSRIKEKRFKDTEEVRYDIPTSLASGTIYTGVAAFNTDISLPLWTIVRTDFAANATPSRERIRFLVAWGARTSGWS